MTRPKHTIESLRAEVKRLRNSNNWLAEKLAEAERMLGISAPLLTLDFDGRPVRLIVENGEPAVLADDVIAFIPNAPKPQSRGQHTYTVAVVRLRRLQLGAREVFSIRRRDLSARLGMSERSLSASLGISTRSHMIGVVTPLGIKTLKTRAPEFCAWVEHEAFPKALAQLSKTASELLKN